MYQLKIIPCLCAYLHAHAYGYIRTVRTRLSFWPSNLPIHAKLYQLRIHIVPTDGLILCSSAKVKIVKLVYAT